jgi:hypothetical protein
MSLMLALNLGLEIVAIHPNPEEILRHQQAVFPATIQGCQRFSAMGSGALP